MKIKSSYFNSSIIAIETFNGFLLAIIFVNFVSVILQPWMH